MQNNPIKKITVISVVLLLIITIILFIWPLLHKEEDRESTFTSKVDEISGDEYSTTKTGGEEGDMLAVLGLTNLRNKGVSAQDTETIRQYISYIAINTYKKKIDSIVSISKDNIEFTVGKDASNTTYSFRVYFESDTYLTGELTTPLKNNNPDEQKTLTFYDSDGKIIEKFSI